mmetsp:Transcript_917/g.2241  ORF Transcript_917/g.2241 Transcript_917/m.2241 type:complete len:216 (-) Transcript_917:1718-2365(-)
MGRARWATMPPWPRRRSPPPRRRRTARQSAAAATAATAAIPISKTTTLTPPTTIAAGTIEAETRGETPRAEGSGEATAKATRVSASSMAERNQTLVLATLNNSNTDDDGCRNTTTAFRRHQKSKPSGTAKTATISFPSRKLPAGNTPTQPATMANGNSRSNNIRPRRNQSFPPRLHSSKKWWPTSNPCRRPPRRRQRPCGSLGYCCGRQRTRTGT